MIKTATRIRITLILISTLVSGFACANPRQQPSLVPQPVTMQTSPGHFSITAETRITCNKPAAEKARQFSDTLSAATGFDIKVVSTAAVANAISLNLNSSDNSIPREGYTLTVTRTGVQITASDPAGLFYGSQTLLQLLPKEIYGRQAAPDIAWTIPCVKIADHPRFQWRGAMLDTSRYFMPKEFILKLIDTLAMHKMNFLHLHLTDDQGWRIEIKKYPRLTKIGAWRSESLIGHYRNRPHKYNGERHGGFYTQDDIRQIVAYAKQRHVNIVPEIEMPGHAQAAIAAYPHLGNTDKELPVRTIWGVNPNILNSNESTILFFQDVLTEVIDLFPSKFIHVGGDEAPKQQWEASPDAQKRIKELGIKDEHELQSYFIKRMDTFLASKGRRLIGWDEILEGGLAPGATVMSWRGERGGITAAQAGHDVVMAPTTYTYFDYYQSKDKSEPLAIGGHLPLKTVYNYNPVPAALSADQAGHILGTQGQLWTEYIPTPQKAEYMGFPRLIALAEVAWTPHEHKDYTGFTERLKTHLERLDALDVNYRPLSPEPLLVARWKSGQTKDTWSLAEYDITKHISAPGQYVITFQDTRGAHRLDIRSTQLLQNETVIATDEHEGITGATSKNNTYVLTVAQHTPGDKYALRATIRSDGGSDSNGEIYLTKRPLSSAP